MMCDLDMDIVLSRWREREREREREQVSEQEREQEATQCGAIDGVGGNLSHGKGLGQWWRAGQGALDHVLCCGSGRDSGGGREPRL
jgi:hypothetical protein